MLRLSRLRGGPRQAQLFRSASAGFATRRGRYDPWRSPLPQTGIPVPEFFGYNVFDQRAMKDNISGSVLESFYTSVETFEPVTATTADSIAKTMLKWALERGATHYAHWFQPLTGSTGEKHDTFLDLDSSGNPITRFRGKDLIMAEPDGSSFPTGGLRETHTARGYTVWDVHSPPFVLKNGNGATLMIPSVFFSWEHNRVLDDKTPLLRSDVALSRATKELFKVIGDSKHTKFFTDSGLEQEYFLIEREYFLKRLDLQTVGRTLQGTAPPKGQELEDQYFASVQDKHLNAIHEFEVEMWKLGVPIMTRHREVAPGQFETAPKFARSSVATDRNLLLMEILKRTARRHDLAALTHEKPFKGVNGSGKHNNWSFGTNVVPSLLEPGNDPTRNLYFMLFLAATVRAVHLHADLLRIAICGPSNDHRLGANEAPPAIVSIYLGDDIEDVVDKFIMQSHDKKHIQTLIDLGLPSLPVIRRQMTDRNRTSTFAFTGNKFEFRAVGSSQTPSRSNMTLNTIMAESVYYLAAEIDKLLKAGKGKDDAIQTVARETLIKHRQIIYNGNGYDPKWQVEAAKRGLPNLKTTPQALKELDKPKNLKVFEDMKVLNAHEIKARKHVFEEDYFKKLVIEAKTLRTMTSGQIIPAATNWSVTLGTSLAHSGSKKYTEQSLSVLNSTLDLAHKGVHDLDEIVQKAAKFHGDSQQAAAFAEAEILPALNYVRENLDKLESLVPAKSWPLPTYHAMLFHQD